MLAISRIPSCFVSAVGLTFLSVSLLAAEEPARKRLVTSIDFTKEYGPDKYFALGNAHIVKSPLGDYREAEAKPEMRFGYRFAIEQVGKPHLAVIRFPDDKRRSMLIMDGTCYDESTAVYGTPTQPISGKMLEIHQIFWPRWKDCSLIFENAQAGCHYGSVLNGAGPAAAAGVEIYEIENLPVTAIPGDPRDGSRRRFGVEYEDPCGTCASLGATNFQEWLDRTISFFHFSGQQTLAYPINWYHGPLFPSKREPAGYFDWSVPGPDRKLYIRWTTQPEDWVAQLLERFEREKLEFRGVLTLLRLGSLMEKMNTDLASIKAGKDTINNMLSNNQVQAGTNDWTTEYNVRNFAKLAEFRGAGKDFGAFPWAYGERQEGAIGRGPIFNPIHPVVQEAMLGYFQEIAERYGKYPAFKGVNLNLWSPVMFSFGSLQSGYDDYSVGLFQKETGIAVPVDAKAPDRFSQRYAFLTKDPTKEKWVAWRCEKIRRLICGIRDHFVRVRPDLTVTLNMGECNRDGGFDARLFDKEPGIQFGNLIFDAWIENWGKHKWFVCDQNDPQARALAVIMGKPAEGICRMNSEYAKDGFWWDSQLRIPSAFQAGINYLDRYANILADNDACWLTRGGLYLNTIHGEMLQPFVRAYRALPAKRFETVGGTTDPVAVRTLVDGGRRYLYLVNRKGQPVDVEVRLKSAPSKATDLATNQSVEVPQQWRMTLTPYELRSFGFAPEVEIVGFSAK